MRPQTRISAQASSTSLIDPGFVPWTAVRRDDDEARRRLSGQTGRTPRPLIVIELFEPALTVQNLDFVAIRIFDEEEPGEQSAFSLELDDVPRVQPERGHSVMFSVQIGHRNREMSVTVTKGVRLGAALVDGQFDLEFLFLIGEVNQRKTIEIQPLGNREAKRFLVKIDGASLINNPNHRMDCLRQIKNSALILE
jgi:hypothetical protein